MKALADQPQRASTSFTLSCALLNIPVSAFAGIEPTGFARKEFVKDAAGNWHPVGRAITNKDDGSIIDRADVVKRAEASNGTWVEFDDDEVAANSGLPPRQAIISRFIPTRSLGQYQTEGLYQIRGKREKGKPVAGADKALALLLDTMKRRKVVALVKVALRGPARFALLDSEGNLRFVVTADAVRQARELPAITHTKQEADLALALIESVGVGSPDLVDESALAIQAAVDQKAAGVPTVATAEPEPTADLLAGLLASIEANKQASKAPEQGAA